MAALFLSRYRPLKRPDFAARLKPPGEVTSANPAERSLERLVRTRFLARFRELE